MSTSFTLTGPFWASVDGRAYGLAIVQPKGKDSVTAYAFTEFSEASPFTEESAVDLQDRLERVIGRILVKGY